MATPGAGRSGDAKSKTDVKLVILGSASVGKTCLLQRYLTGDFAETLSSIGASLALKKWEDWNVALWDTAGEEKYASLSSFYCRGASVAILAFDLTCSQSLQKLNEVFIPLLEDSVDSCLTVVVGTKLDLVASRGRQVKSSEGRELAEQELQRQIDRAVRTNPNSYLKNVQAKRLYFETSAKTGEGVSELFSELQSILLPQLEKSSSSRHKTRPPSQNIKVGVTKTAPPQRQKCCGSGND